MTRCSSKVELGFKSPGTLAVYSLGFILALVVQGICSSPASAQFVPGTPAASTTHYDWGWNNYYQYAYYDLLDYGTYVPRGPATDSSANWYNNLTYGQNYWTFAMTPELSYWYMYQASAAQPQHWGPTTPWYSHPYWNYWTSWN